MDKELFDAEVTAFFSASLFLSAIMRRPGGQFSANLEDAMAEFEMLRYHTKSDVLRARCVQKLNEIGHYIRNVSEAG